MLEQVFIIIERDAARGGLWGGISLRFNEKRSWTDFQVSQFELRTINNYNSHL